MNTKIQIQIHGKKCTCTYYIQGVAIYSGLTADVPIDGV